MRILVVTNSFPLARERVGGSAAASLSEALRDRGEELYVLCARTAASEPPAAPGFPYPVARELVHFEEAEAGPEERHNVTERNRSVTKGVLSRWEPDVVLI